MKTKVINAVKNTAMFLAKAAAVLVFLLFLSGKVNDTYIGLKHVVADVLESMG